LIIDNELQASGGREWIQYGLRWFLLVFLSGLALFHRNQISYPGSNDDIGMAFLVSAVANGVIFLCLVTPWLRSMLPLAMLVGDLIIAAMFIVVSQGESLLVISTASAVILSGIIHADMTWSVAQVAGVLITTLVVLLIRLGGESLPSLVVPMLIGGMLGVIAMIAGYTLQRQVGTLRRQVDQMNRFKTEQIVYMRDRTRSIYELAYAMSSTMKYEKILDVALEAGYLGLNFKEQNGAGLIAGVFLFHVEDEQLHLVSGRRFTRADFTRTIPGKEGIVGQALREAVPVFGTQANKDPELQVFVGLQYTRSLLVIPLCAGFDNFGFLVYGAEKPNMFTEDHSELLTAIGVQVTIALQNALLYRSLLEEKERIVEVEEEARKKLARDLHDGATQSIAAIAMRMSYVYKLMEKRPDDVLPELKKIEEIARKTTQEVRHLLFTLRPLVLESQGIAAALQALADKMRETHDQAVAVRVERDIEQYLDRQQQGVIFYIVEEAINNARKHAHASLINVSVTRQDDLIIVQIADNGVGFNTSIVDKGYEKRGSLGMVNMRERAQLLEGTLTVDSEEGKGTVITVLVPLRSPDKMPLNGHRMGSRETTKLALAAAARVRQGETQRSPYG
jgi:signal transduction histidine kinase